MLHYLWSETSEKHAGDLNHPESQSRLPHSNNPDFLLYLKEQGIEAENIETLATDDAFLLAHTPRHIRKIKRATEMASRRPIYMDEDTFVSSNSFEALRGSASVVMRAAEIAVYSQKDESVSHVFCAIRPPSHHASRDKVGGFCLVNFTAMSVEYAKKLKPNNKTLIIDFDVHHGNGTQEIFYDRNDVYYLSIHSSAAYPNSGMISNTGRDEGVGFTKNIPLNGDESSDKYLKLLKKGLDDIYKDFSPDLIVLSSGYDAHKDDPMGIMNLNSNTYKEAVLSVGERFKNIPSISVLEGGYNPEAIASSIEMHLDALR